MRPVQSSAQLTCRDAASGTITLASWRDTGISPEGIGSPRCRKGEESFVERESRLNARV